MFSAFQWPPVNILQCTNSQQCAWPLGLCTFCKQFVRSSLFPCIFLTCVQTPVLEIMKFIHGSLNVIFWFGWKVLLSCPCLPSHPAGVSSGCYTVWRRRIQFLSQKHSRVCIWPLASEPLLWSAPFHTGLCQTRSVLSSRPAYFHSSIRPWWCLSVKPTPCSALWRAGAELCCLTASSSLIPRPAEEEAWPSAVLEMLATAWSYVPLVWFLVCAPC